jgi:hypothetical protein
VVAEGRRQQQGLERVERARLLVPEEVAAEPEGLRALAVLEEQAEPEGLREQAVQQVVQERAVGLSYLDVSEV